MFDLGTSFLASVALPQKMSEKEHELLWTALDDIARMHKNEGVGRYAQNALKKIETTYGNY
jgi:hypothetical protein